MTDFATLSLPEPPTVTAPDGSDVRVLLGLAGGGMAHFHLAAGRVSKAVTTACAGTCRRLPPARKWAAPVMPNAGRTHDSSPTFLPGRLLDSSLARALRQRGGRAAEARHQQAALSAGQPAALVKHVKDGSDIKGDIPWVPATCAVLAQRVEIRHPVALYRINQDKARIHMTMRKNANLFWRLAGGKQGCMKS
jgi:hypothetical protein